ncbi:MAG TPA: aminotransferase class I/II-fold pyridoxal phosphate-dependent enzyme [Candidatus Cloacimonadota bacterium]|nr:aminotransferase class I/II-fold pyridoxal phosphate-dependent enzyme [Candidatus Cloacimonadota bacterium]HPT71233.1 aminotransferase class I/II-fold pyridoxal phosphate-dependent enzyme [Candidatus Cloacimonadota bacterium]
MNFSDKFVFELAEEYELVKTIHFNPYYQKIDSGADLHVKIHGEQYLNLASNNYLALANHPEIIAVMKKALDQYGASMCGTPVACGTVDIYQDTADYISKFLGMEDTIIYPSCYQANVAAISALVKPNDVVFVDRKAHSSIIEGIRATGCKIMPFKHNSVEFLSDLVKKSENFQNRFVATESVFSTEGSIAPFDEIYQLALENDVIPIIDDSHGIGVIGKTGKGILEEKKITNYGGIYTASTGKALGVSGGFVSSNEQIIDFLRYSCPGLLYSTALPPTLLAGTKKALEIVARDGAELVKVLSSNKNYLYENLRKNDFHILQSEAFICSLLTGSNENTLRICKALFENKILTTPFIYPSVSKNNGVIRMIPRVDLTQDQMDHVISVLFMTKELNPELFR